MAPDARSAEFDPSPDHFKVSSSGAAIVKSYSLAVYEASTSTPIQTIGLGKPNPDPDGKIRVGFVTLLNPAPVAGVIYVARVAAVGPGGKAYSDLSNTFSFSGVCGASITPSSQAFPSSSGTGTVAVRIAPGCPWTAVSSATWLTITGGASGTESGSVTFSVSPNPGTTGRAATIKIAGEIFSVTQAGDTCSYSLSPASQSVGGGSGTVSVTVTTGTGCPWSAFSSTSWITVKSTAPGSGSATITFSVNAVTAM